MYKFTLDNTTTFSLESLEADDADEALSLCDRCVGENLYRRLEIESTIDSLDRFFYLLRDDKNNIAGYIYYYITTEEEVRKFSNLEEIVFSKIETDHTKKVGKIQSIGVDDKYRGMGLSSKMMGFALSELKKLDIDIAYIVCWKPKGKVPLGKTISLFDFTFLSIAKKVWYYDTRLICPYCKGRCLCDGEVYYKLL